MPMKILFLDIDGVLNSNRTAVAFNGYPHDFSEKDAVKFDNVAIGLIQKLCKETGCKVILSSDWRYSSTIEEVSYAFNIACIGCTSITSDYEISRGAEIQAWLNEHSEVTHYAIVDDIAQMLSSQASNFVQTDPEVGLSLRNYLDLKHILTRVSL